MKIDVRINKTFENKGVLKAVASVTLDDMFVVHGVKVIKTDKGIQMAMPGDKHKAKDGKEKYSDIFHPISAESRSILESSVFTAYDAVKCGVENN